MGNHLLRRRSSPVAEIFGGVGVGDERDIADAGKSAVDRRPRARIGLGAGDDEVFDVLRRQNILEVRFFEGVAVRLLHYSFVVGRGEGLDDLPLR